MKNKVSISLVYDTENIKITMHQELTFERTCKFIYLLTSKRIQDKYKQWENDRNHVNTTYEDFYPENRNLFGNILKSKPTKDNPYLITPKIVPVLLNELNFRDANEIFWGNDIELYLEDLFTCLILDMKDFQEYTKHWCDFQLINEKQIKKFYHKFFVEKEENINKLKDDFIDFTYNTYLEFRIVESNGICECIEQNKQINDKNRSECLNFTYLPEKIKIYVEEILVPHVGLICFQNLLEEDAKSEN